jgi:hypothetical protein
MGRQSRKQMKGGNGAAEFGGALYGTAGNQHAVPGGGNLIATNGGSATPSTPTPGPSGPAKVGGKRQKKNQKGGKTFFADLAVPAGLLYFQQRSTKKRGGKRQKQQSRKRRGSRKNL